MSESIRSLGIGRTSLATAGTMQEPVTLRLSGAEEPSTTHDRLPPYALSLLSSAGAKVTSKESSEPGLM